MSPAGLRVGLIQRFLPGRSRGGVGHFAHGLSNALSRRGHAVTVFSHDPAPADARYRVVRLPVSDSAMRRRMAPLGFPFQLARQDFSGFDVLHAQGDEQWLPRRTAPPVVRTMHGSAWAEAVHNGWRLGSPRRFLLHGYFYLGELVAALRADALVTVSADTARYYPRDHEVIPNGVDLERFGGPGGPRAKQPTILFVGELGTRKRGQRLVRAVQDVVRPAIPEVELWLVCPEACEGDGIVWHGAVDDERLADLYREAWVFCLPSSYEGFGRPYLEAMAAGTPVVATPNPGAREVLDGGRYGMLVEDGELGPALVRLLGDSEAREDYGRRGAERARDYGWDRVAERYERVYERVLSRRAARRSPA